MADSTRGARDFVTDVQEEMKKVTWPDWPQLKNSTFVILVFVFALALLIFGMDIVVRNVLDVVRGLAGA